MAHTPGPWTIDEDGDTNVMGETIAIGILDPQGHRVGEADGRDLSLPEAEANARLIAAAPELLAALVALLPLSETRDGHLYGSEFVAADAAIAKATQA